MAVTQQVRDLDSIRLPRWGAVVRDDGVVPWAVTGSGGDLVEPVQLFLRDFVARGNRPASVRSYAYGLLRWWRWLSVVGVPWDRATSAEVRDLVLWLGMHSKADAESCGVSSVRAGSVNLITGKQYPGEGYAVRTIRHSNAVIGSFYEYWIDRESRPLVNPVPRDPVRGRYGPQWAFDDDPRTRTRVRYNPPLPRRRPRAMSDEQWTALFGALKSHRDRAIVAVLVASGARAGELLRLRPVDLNWGDQLVRLHRKGSGAEQWVPAGPEAFVWLRLYVAEVGERASTGPLWVTLRRRDHGTGLDRQPLTYDALRAVMRRLNDLLATNWTMHDLRHTCALRMAADNSLSLRDIQTILGHAHVSTTAEVYLVEDEKAVMGRVAAHLVQQRERAIKPVVPAAPQIGYDSDDLAVLFPGGRR
jgi:integrase/recombinase XerD